MASKTCFWLIILALILPAAFLWGADSASFVDLGFSPDGRIYMFAQYGVQYKSWKPWAELFVVDVPRNNFVSGGRVSYAHGQPVAAGQDGAGALYQLIARNAALADRYGVNFLRQGQVLYIALDNGGPSGETIEFRDFENNTGYTARLVPGVEGSGDNLRSSFYINLERRARDGTKRSYTVGTPHLKRPRVMGYRIKKVIVAPQDGSLVFVIEMSQRGEGGQDIRYMVEAIRL
jgi:predicted secreted protein